MSKNKKTPRADGGRRTDTISNYLLIISYDGSGFSGWQSQDNAGRTVQGELERVAKAVFKQDICLEASGRTDAGVHAYGQAASFKIAGRLKPEKIKNVLNHALPGDIHIEEVFEKDSDFHARYSARGKTYVYRICCSQEKNAFLSRYCHYVAGALNTERMRSAAEHFCGVRDFKNYSASNHGKKSTVRRIRNIEISEHRGDFISSSAFGLGNGVCAQNSALFLEIRITGDGFLWKMVRMIVATLIQVGLGNVEPSSVPNLIKQKNRKKDAAPAGGLFLERVYYDDCQFDGSSDDS